MFQRNYLLCLSAAAAIATSSASVGRADFGVCNNSGESVIVDFVGPSTSCTSGEYHDRSVLDVDVCATIFFGSASGMSFFFRAESQASDKTWEGAESIWIPYESFEADLTQNSWCMPAAPCGTDVSCDDGKTYQMYYYTAIDADETLTIDP